MDDGHDGEAAPSTPSIEQAKGILMARHGIGPAAAATRLRTAARYARRPLEEIAEDLISDLLRRGRQPVPPLPSAPAGGGRTAIGVRPHRTRSTTPYPTLPFGPASAR